MRCPAPMFTTRQLWLLLAVLAAAWAAISAALWHKTFGQQTDNPRPSYGTGSAARTERETLPLPGDPPAIRAGGSNRRKSSRRPPSVSAAAPFALELARRGGSPGGGGSNATSESSTAAAATSYALVYPTSDCSETGGDDPPLRINSTAHEKNCRNCRDLCSVSFPAAGEEKAIEYAGVKSIRLAGSAYRLFLYPSCAGTWDYPDEGVMSIVRPSADGAVTKCVAVTAVFGHVKFVPAKPRMTDVKGLLPVARSDDPIEESYVLIYPSEYCNMGKRGGGGGPEPFRINYSGRDGRGGDGRGSGNAKCDHCRDLCSVRFASDDFLSVAKRIPKSLRVFGKYQLDVHHKCLGTTGAGETGYHGTVRAEDRCVNLDQAVPHNLGHIRFVERGAHASSVAVGSVGSPGTDDDNGATKIDGAPGSYHVVFSTESSTYMAWQSRTLFHSFRQTQHLSSGAKLTRLLTAKEPDDLMDEFITVQVPRHPYSKKYSPYNKPDSLDKWLSSAHAPKEEIIVVIDPDNFLLNDLTPWINKVQRGRPIAQSAWYMGDKKVDQLWKIICERNCDRNSTDHVAVPIFIHRDDLKEIAPFWGYYTMKVIWWETIGRLTQFKGHQMISWSVEMIGYVFAAAHVGVHHTIERYLQLRDVDPSPPHVAVYEKIPMVHAGRAFFPESYQQGARWHNPEGEELAKSMRRGRQVWCKCNYTAWDEVPWPLPDAEKYGNVDFVSNHTLRLLHEAKESKPTFLESKYRKVGGTEQVFTNYD